MTDQELAEGAARLAAVRARVEAACREAGRDPAEVTIVGACKRQPAERIASVVIAGLGELGENYVQDARRIQPELDALLEEHGAPRPRWRMIGHLQRNKARHAVALFDAVDTVDTAALASELDRRAGALDRTIEVCLQINLSGEAQKSGAAPDEAEALLAACEGLASLRVVGLMTMPAADPDPQAARETFARLRALRDTLRSAPGGAALDTLNMGMSADLEVAIAEGATRIRVGTALFGERAPRPA